MLSSVETRIIAPPRILYGAKVCLFVSYSPEGQLKPHVAYHLRALAEQGFSCILIQVVDRIMNKSYKSLAEGVAGCVVRSNAGFDFGAWADGFRLFPEVWSAERVLLVNDSIYGPTEEFGLFMNRVLAADADLVGLTETFEARRHIQSYFVLFNRKLLQSHGFRNLWLSVTNLREKIDVIMNYEVQLSGNVEKLGFKTLAMFPFDKRIGQPLNPVIYQWKSLLDNGFPYVKVELVRDLLSMEGRRSLMHALRGDKLAQVLEHA